MAATDSLPRELALRIGLAARVLPDVSPRQLLDALLDKLGAPLSQDKLAQITVAQLRASISGSETGEEPVNVNDAAVPHYKEAVRYLWGELGEADDLPKAEPYNDGDLPDSIRVALASNQGADMDGHFGSCLRFLVYQVNQQQARLIDLRSALSADDAEDRNAARAELIGDCQIVYVVSIGGPAAAKVIRAGIYPIKLSSEHPAAEVLSKLQNVLAGAPPPWLAKIMGHAPEARVRFQTEIEEDTP